MVWILMFMEGAVVGGLTRMQLLRLRDGRVSVVAKYCLCFLVAAGVGAVFPGSIFYMSIMGEKVEPPVLALADWRLQGLLLCALWTGVCGAAVPTITSRLIDYLLKKA
jgi:hypothetical protein